METIKAQPEHKRKPQETKGNQQEHQRNQRKTQENKRNLTIKQMEPDQGTQP